VGRGGRGATEEQDAGGHGQLQAGRHAATGPGRGRVVDRSVPGAELDHHRFAGHDTSSVTES
jgi:hypothetical protein